MDLKDAEAQAFKDGNVGYDDTSYADRTQKSVEKRRKPVTATNISVMM